MANVQHSSASVEWYTPRDVVARFHDLAAGQSTLDPCASPLSPTGCDVNILPPLDGLAFRWRIDYALVNPPGGKVLGRSRAAIWYRYAEAQVKAGNCGAVLFVGFNQAILRTSQSEGPGALQYPICVPRKRLHFWRPGASDKPPRDSVLVCITQSRLIREVFREVFSVLGDVR